jgi:hypothetical protein
LTLDASSYLPANIGEQSGPIIPSSEYLVSYGLPEMMTSAKATMKIKRNLLGLLRVQAYQKYPWRVFPVQGLVNEAIPDRLEL